MSESLRHIYAEKALSQIPRLLTLQDRNPFSPTYGCFKRTYWLDKTVDFPDALPQFGVLSLALAYACDFPGNMYKNQPKIRDWILAGMRYWTTIQHRDGSFDEFYPNEHGWTGPTGFLLYAMLKSYMLLDERQKFPQEFRDEFLVACRKAARYIIEWDEHGVLANHHAMAVLPVYYAYHVLQEENLRMGYERKLAAFLSHHTSEGWSLEYDGADIGYLSATVSFLGKVWKLNHDQCLRKVMEESVRFLSYFVYPNGFYAGSIGSRNTLHFYPHGCELLAKTMPLAGRVADAMLESLRDGKIVPAEIMDDRYFLYRIPEHLESFMDFGARAPVCTDDDRLPYERPDFRTVFPAGRFFVQKREGAYLLGNAAKGGIVKFFNVAGRTLLFNDCGIIGRTTSGCVLTSQWIDPSFTFVPRKDGFSVSGALHAVPAHRTFTPVTFILFRIFLLLLGWHTGMAYRMKGLIRALLMLKSRTSGVHFFRDVAFVGGALHMVDTVTITDRTVFSRLQIGDEFFVRYVPQSRFFQSQELPLRGYDCTPEQIARLSRDRLLRIERVIPSRPTSSTRVPTYYS